MRAHDKDYIAPAPNTDTAEWLFSDDAEWSSAKKSLAVPVTGIKNFSSHDDYQTYVRVGKHHTQASPCVDLGILSSQYPVVYEEWQLHSKVSNEIYHYRCRRQRHRHRRRQVAEHDRQRALTKRGYVGTGCTARHTVFRNFDGSVRAVFRGTHNHDCQGEYAMKFLNAVKVCKPICELVDKRLLAGVDNPKNICNSIHAETRAKHNEQNSMETLRTLHMALLLNPKHVQNRRQALGLPKRPKKATATPTQKHAGGGKRKAPTPAAHLPKAKARTSPSEETINTQPSRTNAGHIRVCLVSHCFSYLH